MDYKLLDFFNSLKDPRRGQGQRHKLSDVLTIIIMAILSGYQGLRGFARFAASNEKELTEVLGLKHGVPCFFTIRQLLTSLDEQILVDRFIEWVRTYGPSMDGFISMDGKAISGTSSGGNSSMQNFISVVSAFGHQSGLIYGMKAFENGKSGEAETLHLLIKQLGLQNKVFTMDALHAQKKHLT